MRRDRNYRCDSIATGVLAQLGRVASRAMTASTETSPGRLRVGDPAPDFSLPTADGTSFTLSDHRDQQVIVYFYPAAMTAGCTTQACDFRDSLASLQAAGYTV